MKSAALDNEMNDYFMQLNENEKISVVQLIKTFLSIRKEYVRINIEQYNKEISESETEFEKGDFYTHEEVIKISGKSLNGK